MIDLQFKKSPVNIEKLHEDLHAALDKFFFGVTISGDQVRIHVSDTIPPDQRDQVALLVLNHNPAVLTSAQQTDKDRTALLASLQKPWDQWSAEDKDSFLRLLAEVQP